MKNVNFTLRDILNTIHLTEPTIDQTYNRKHLCKEIRRNENLFFSASGDDITIIRHLLGWNDDTLQNFINSACVSHSSPHASMNIFEPNYAHPWIHVALNQIIKQKYHENSFHIRTTMTHGNMGDKKYKPHSWWIRDSNNQIKKIRLFSKNHRNKNKILLCKTLPDISISELNILDREGYRLAKLANNYAYSCIIYRTFIEKQAGISIDNAKLEIPIDLLCHYFFKKHDLMSWIKCYQECISEHGIDSEKSKIRIIINEKLQSCDIDFYTKYLANLQSEQSFFIIPNFLSFAVFYTLGLSVITGGKKMYSYLHLMHEIIEQFSRRMTLDIQLPCYVGLTNTNNYQIMPLENDDRALLEADDIISPFNIGVTDHGVQILTNLNSLLSEKYSNVFHETV